MIINMKGQSPFSYNHFRPFQLYGIISLIVVLACSAPARTWEDVNEEGTFLVYRRQSQIGEESYSITSDKETIVVKSLQGENERGRITGVSAELHLTKDLTPTYYVNQRIANGDTTNIFRMEMDADTISIWEKHFDVVKQAIPSEFFPLHSTIPAAMEMMLYHHYIRKGASTNIPTLPRGEISMTYKGQDVVMISGQKIVLHRYVVEGINWGGRTIWLDEGQNLVAIVKANTQIRELIRKGYEEALPVFVAGNVKEQIDQLAEYTRDLKEDQSKIMILIGADIVDGLSDITQEDMALVIENGKIAAIEKLGEFDVPVDARIMDVSGKTLIPGLWDMHAHANQVQWAPAYLAGGITTILDNGNEIEFATAFRDAIDKDGMLGPDLLLAGMTDGPGERGNGVIRATSVEQAREVVDLYFRKGYKQIKIYNSIESDVLGVLTEEAHMRGMTVTGHVPRPVGNAVDAVELGMDQLSHDRVIFSILFPEKTSEELSELDFTEINTARIDKAIAFLLEHQTVIDPTINISVIRSMSRGTRLETIEPGADRIAYELWEGKRFRRGISPSRVKEAKERIVQIMQIVGKFYKAGIPIVAGTDNIVPVFSLYQEIETYQKLAGLTPFESIQTATIIPARAMGLASKTGTLEVGKEADIAILDKNPLQDINNIRTVTAVISNGNYFESNPLWQLADFKPGN